jgi:hypothetical protein
MKTIIRTPNKTNAALFPIFISLLSKDYNHGTQKPRTLFPSSLELVTSPTPLSIFLYQIKMGIQLGEILILITENALRNLEKLGKKTR